MRAAWIFSILLGCVACAGPGSAPHARDDAVPEASDPGGPDTPEPDLPGGEDLADDGPPPDVPRTCEGVLLPGQCISAAGCPSWTACLGVGGCEDPPCWGLCQDYPGACLPATLPKPCEVDPDCGPDAVCVGRVPGTGEEDGLSGLCRKRPAANACYEDAHCPAGQRCAGESVCRLDAYCSGPEYPGRCVDPPPTGRCFENTDCPAGQRCAGTAWCASGDDACPGDAPGTCEEGTGCFSDEDCAGSPNGGFCVGAFRCREDAPCAFADSPGTCAPPPGLRQCWQQDHCGVGFACRAALSCPAGSLCHATGAAHPGLCGEPPVLGDGVVVTLDTNLVLRDKPFRVLVLNQGAVPLFLDPCFVAVVQFKNDSGLWTEAWIPEARHPSCEGGASLPLWPLVPGSGMAVRFTVDVPDTTYRVQVPYRLGCEQGVVRTEARCATDALVANTMEFKVL